MITLDALRAALRTDRPWLALDKMVRAEQAAGRQVQEIYKGLHSLVKPLRAADNPSDDLEDALGDILDALSGACSPEWQYTDQRIGEPHP